MPRVTEEYRQQRIHELHRAAWSRIAAQGLERLTMEDIIAAAGFSPGMIYNYFPGRDELVESAILAAGAHLRAALAEAVAVPSPSPAELFKAVTVAVDRAAADEPGAVETAWAAVARIPSHGGQSAEFGERYERFLATVEGHVPGWQARGAVGSGASPRQFAKLFVTILVGYFTQASALGRGDTAGAGAAGGGDAADLALALEAFSGPFSGGR